MRRLKTRFLPRAAATARMGAQLGKAAAKRVLRTSEHDDEALGEALVAELDQLKGLAMKVGQILSYMDVGLPPGTVERLTALQSGVEGLPFETVAEVVEAELGAPVAECFDRFDPAPVAAASIGQVHRAAVGERELAVKIRYPTVRETLEGDFTQLGSLGRVASLASAVDGPALVRELHDRMLEECDYALEARRQAAFAAAWADDPDVVVPGVLAERCSDGVLTSDWVDGAPLTTVRDGDPATVARLAVALLRFNVGSLLRDHRLQADPHPGNFLVTDDGRLVALDYGCVREFDADTVAAWRQLARVVVHGEKDRFLDAMVATGQVPRPDRFDLDEGWALQRFAFAPYLEPHFRFTRRWWLTGMRFTRPTAKNQRVVDLPPPWIWLMRMQWGLHSVLVRLHAQGDFRTPFLELLER